MVRIRILALFSERKVKTHEVAAAPLILTGVGCQFGFQGGEFLMPRQASTAMHERIVAIPDGEHI
jgi:hypothetical protein